MTRLQSGESSVSEVVHQRALLPREAVRAVVLLLQSGRPVAQSASQRGYAVTQCRELT